MIPLPDAYADVVTAAQAFHWFDHDVALPEIARVLRPGGRLALVWNSRDDRDPWMARLSAIIGNETVRGLRRLPDARRERAVRPRGEREFTMRAGRSTGRRLLDLVLSRSYCAKLPQAEREPILADVGKLYDETAGADGVRLPYVTECYRTAVKGAT